MRLLYNSTCIINAVTEHSVNPPSPTVRGLDCRQQWGLWHIAKLLGQPPTHELWYVSNLLRNTINFQLLRVETGSIVMLLNF